MNQKRGEKGVVQRENSEQKEQKNSEKFIKKIKKSSPLVTRSTLERKRAELNKNIIESQKSKEAGEDLARRARKREKQLEDRIAELERLLKEKDNQTKELQEKLTESKKDKEEIEKLQQHVKKDVHCIVSLQGELKLLESKWQDNILKVNDKLFETQGQLKNTSDILENSQLNERELNEEVSKLKSEINLVKERLVKLQVERENNLSSISSHHQEELNTIEKEKKNLVKEYEELTKLYEENQKQLKDAKFELEVSKKIAQKEYEELKNELDKLNEELKDNQDKTNQLEQNYRLKTHELEETITHTNKSLNNKLDDAFQDNQNQKNIINNLEEKNEELQSKLIELQSKSNNANIFIDQQHQEISEKNKLLSDLFNKLVTNNKLIEKLQTESDQPIEEKKSFSSEKSLLAIIESQKEEIQSLQKSLFNQKSHELAEKTNTISETVEHLPKKNSAALHLSLLGGGLAIIALCLNLIKKRKQESKQ